MQCSFPLKAEDFSYVSRLCCVILIVLGSVIDDVSVWEVSLGCSGDIDVNAAVGEFW